MSVPTTFRGESLVSFSPSVAICANPHCAAKFKKLGHGMLFAEKVENPLAWGLPPEAKQKVVWLCGACADSFDLEFEPARRQVILYFRRGRTRGMAA